MLNKARDIMWGLRYFVFKDKTIEETATKRAEICGQCDKLNDAIYLKCSECGCSIPLKIRSVTETNNCPLGKW